MDVPLVWMVESVDSVRIADALQAACMKHARGVKVLVQVNTSGEPSMPLLPRRLERCGWQAWSVIVDSARQARAAYRRPNAPRWPVTFAIVVASWSSAAS